MANLYRFRQWSLSVLRVVLAFVFAYHGYLKLFVPQGFTGTIAFFTAIGMPAPVFSALVVSVVEFLGGIFLLLGLLAKWASLLLITNMLVALFMVHIKSGFLIAYGGFEYVLLLIFCLLVLLLNGPGSLAVDRYIFDYKEETEKKEAKKPGRKSVKVKAISGSGIIAKTGITKEPGYLYFLDKNGDVARVEMARRGERTNKKHEVLAKVGVKRKEGFLYYIDSNGNVARSKIARG